MDKEQQIKFTLDNSFQFGEIEEMTEKDEEEIYQKFKKAIEEENKQFLSNMKNVLEIEKKNAVKEFAEKLNERIKKFVWRGEIPECMFNEIMQELLKEYT